MGKANYMRQWKLEDYKREYFKLRKALEKISECCACNYCRNLAKQALNTCPRCKKVLTESEQEFHSCLKKE